MSSRAIEPKYDSRLVQTIKASQLKIKQKNESMKTVDQEYLKELADEVKNGKDKLYGENFDNIERLYSEAKEI